MTRGEETQRALWPDSEESCVQRSIPIALRARSAPASRGVLRVPRTVYERSDCAALYRVHKIRVQESRHYGSCCCSTFGTRSTHANSAGRTDFSKSKIVICIGVVADRVSPRSGSRNTVCGPRSLARLSRLTVPVNQYGTVPKFAVSPYRFVSFRYRFVGTRPYRNVGNLLRLFPEGHLGTPRFPKRADWRGFKHPGQFRARLILRRSVSPASRWPTAMREESALTGRGG